MNDKEIIKYVLRDNMAKYSTIDIFWSYEGANYTGEEMIAEIDRGTDVGRNFLTSITETIMYTFLESSDKGGIVMDNRINYTIDIRASLEGELEQREIYLEKEEIDEIIENINMHLEDEFDQRIDYELSNLGYV